MTYRFTWTVWREGFVVKLQFTDENLAKAKRRVADVYGMTLPVFNRFLQREGFELSIEESPRPEK